MTISPFSQVALKTAVLKALLELLFSKFLFNSALKLAGLEAFLFFNNWILLLTSGAVMSGPLIFCLFLH
jgi:hypothetical protein